MRKFLFAVTFIAVILYSCDNIPRQVYEPPQKIEQPATPTQPPQRENASLEETINETPSSPTISIASFNIQIFGKSKRGKEDVIGLKTLSLNAYEMMKNRLIN